MQSVTQFMEGFFKDRTEVLKKTTAITTAFRQQFLTERCQYWYSEMVKESEEERILTVAEANSKAEVITTGCGTGRRCLRYSLLGLDSGWSVDEVEWACGICDGTGVRKGHPCKLCKGKGWVGGNR
jgi:hypothetical protein